MSSAPLWKWTFSVTWWSLICLWTLGDVLFSLDWFFKHSCSTHSPIHAHTHTHPKPNQKKTKTEKRKIPESIVRKFFEVSLLQLGKLLCFPDHIINAVLKRKHCLFLSLKHTYGSCDIFELNLSLKLVSHYTTVAVWISAYGTKSKEWNVTNVM